MGVFYYCEDCHWIYPETHVEEAEGEHICPQCGDTMLVELSAAEAREAFLAVVAEAEVRP